MGPGVGGGGRGERKRETFPVSHAGNGSKDATWWPPSLSLILESWGSTCGQRYGSGWLRWLLKQGGVILPPQIIGTS
jgi:hypothetical protein